MYYYVPIPVGAMRGQMVKENKEKPSSCSHILVQPALPKGPLLLGEAVVGGYRAQKSHLNIENRA